MTPVRWDGAALAGIAGQPEARLPLLPAESAQPIASGLDLWDMWPLAHPDGTTAVEQGRSLWFFLAAPQGSDPDERHRRARIDLLTHDRDGWRAHGPALPDSFGPGACEWSGSAVIDGAGGVTLYFTAAGRRGEPFSYEQRLFETRASLTWGDGVPVLADWTPARASLAADGHFYRATAQCRPLEGRIKGFRDPAYFRDPADGAEYLTFTGSAGWVDAACDGVVGLARRTDGEWKALPPLVTAIDVASELERPHLVATAGRYYLFWSTPAHRFAPGITGVTGLYALTAPRLSGPWTPVNGTSLVVANPAASPSQAYCWWVTGELDVLSFVDLPGSLTSTAAERRARFGGVPAPFFRLSADGARLTIADSSPVAQARPATVR